MFGAFSYKCIVTLYKKSIVTYQSHIFYIVFKIHSNQFVVPPVNINEPPTYLPNEQVSHICGDDFSNNASPRVVMNLCNEYICRPRVTPLVSFPWCRPSGPWLRARRPRPRERGLQCSVTIRWGGIYLLGSWRHASQSAILVHLQPPPVVGIMAVNISGDYRGVQACITGHL